MRLTYRTVRVLTFIGEHPGASNREIADGAGIADQGQISKLLTRLERLKLVTNLGEGQIRAPPTSGTSPTAAPAGGARDPAALSLPASSPARRRPPLRSPAPRPPRGPTRSRAVGVGESVLTRLLGWRLARARPRPCGRTWATLAWLLHGGARGSARGARRLEGAQVRHRIDAAPARPHERRPRERRARTEAAGGAAERGASLPLSALPARRAARRPRPRARRRRRYVRLRVGALPHRPHERRGRGGDVRGAAQAPAARWWRRLLLGQPSVALEVHHASSAARDGAGASACSPSRARRGSSRWSRRRCAAPTPTAACGDFPPAARVPAARPCAAPEEARGVHQARQGARPLRAGARAADESVADRDGRVWRGRRSCSSALTPAPALLRTSWPSTATSATRTRLSRERREHLSCAIARSSRRPSCAAA